MNNSEDKCTDSRETGAELYAIVQRIVYDPNIDLYLADSPGMQLLSHVEEVADRAFLGNDRKSELTIHRALYQLLLAEFSTPWDHAVINTSHPLVASIRHAIESRWEAAERRRHARNVVDLARAKDFEERAAEVVRGHSSNVMHPLFGFLRDDASLNQVREFFFQESPLEVFFGDIIACLLPGVYGEPKMEVAQNYWDEVGQGKHERVHRNLRQDMMKVFGIPVDAHIKHFEHLLLEELVLINTYLSLATNRKGLGQLVGALLATENMIPGRFEHQIDGMRRLGVRDDQMAYMLEHTTVDVEHAHGWMKHVVQPLLGKSAVLQEEIALGLHRRLDAAGAICDRMMAHLTAFVAPGPLSFER